MFAKILNTIEDLCYAQGKAEWHVCGNEEPERKTKRRGGGG